MLQQVVVERRHQVEVGDALALEKLERTGGVEARLAHEAAVDERHREQRAYAHGVIERHDPERALAVRVEILGDVGERGRALGAVIPGHALRAPGGARCVEHERHVVGAGPRLAVAGLRREQILEARAAGAGAAHRDARQSLGGGRTGHGLGRGGLEHHGPRRGILRAIVQLLRAHAPVERRDDDARELARPVQAGRLPTVLQRRHQMIAAPEAHARQRANQPQDPLVPLRIAQAHIAVDDGRRFRVALDGRDKALSEIKHARPPCSGRSRRRPPSRRARCRCSRCSDTDARSAPPEPAPPRGGGSARGSW